MKSKKHNQIVFLSGKGGTGKTTFAASIAGLLENKIIVDCDVDAANLYLILNPYIRSGTKYFSGIKAEIDESKCNQCGLCEELCRFDAIKDFKVDTIGCEGCGFCIRACPQQAIDYTLNASGYYYEGNLEDGTPFFYSNLKPGEGNSGKLVSVIKNEALKKVDEKTEWLIIDGPPGIGCPVNASLASSDYVVIVTEATTSGLHDLKRLINLIKIFNYPYGIIINKYDINNEVTESIKNLAEESNIPVLGLIPYDIDFIRSVQAGKTIIEYSPGMKEKFQEILININLQIKYQ